MAGPLLRQPEYKMNPRMAAALRMMQAGSSTAPVGHPLQALARIAQAISGKYQYSQAEDRQKGERAAQAEALRQALGAYEGAPGRAVETENLGPMDVDEVDEDAPTVTTHEPANRSDRMRAMVSALMGSPDTIEMIPGALGIAKAIDPEAKMPETREVKRGGEIVTEQWNPQTGKYESIATAPRFNPDKKPSNLDRRIAALAGTGVPKEIATGIAAGRYATTRDPVSGIAQVIDKATGQIIFDGRQSGPAPRQAPAAPREADMLPGERRLLDYHRKNLREGTFLDDDQGLTTVFITGVTGPDGRIYNVPGFADGRRMTEQEAAQRAGQIGWQNFPSYDNGQKANEAAQRLHKIIEREGREFRATPPVDNAAEPATTLWGMVDNTTGLVPGLQETAQGLTGQFGVNVASEKLLENRQMFRSAQNDLIRSLSINPRFPVGEIKRIREEVNIEPGAFTDERTLRSRMRSVDDYLRRRLAREKKTVEDTSLPAETRKNAATAAKDIEGFLGILGVPQSAAPEAGDIPPPDNRTLNQTYQTPKGPAIWRGTGWELVNPDG